MTSDRYFDIHQKNNKNLVNIALLYVKIFNNDNIIFPFYGEIVFH